MSTPSDLPSALAARDALAQRFAGELPAVFLDYDGTMTPIVPNPEDAVLTPDARAVLARTGGLMPTAIVSGRDTDDVAALVGVDGLTYAGSHGFDILRPDGARDQSRGEPYLADLDAAERVLDGPIAAISGAAVERKRFAIAVHYRGVADADVPRVEATVDEALSATGGLRKTGGKKIFELRPDVDWHKGKAVEALMASLGLGNAAVPVYIGDDLTDEDAFTAIRGQGVGICVEGGDHHTAADYSLADPAEVVSFLDWMTQQRDG